MIVPISLFVKQFVNKSRANVHENLVQTKITP
nr:MAG TPA: hypothetical protein [Caudoviricetes sp.]